MNELETQVLDRLADAYNAFVELPVQHPFDSGEFVAAIHAAQMIVMKRLAVRDNPSYFNGNSV